MSTGSPQAWPSRDCSLQYCSIYCPQWCYFYFRPPPPASTSPSFALSPLLVAIIVILSCAFFAVAAYLAASKNCYSRRPAAAAATPAVARRPNPSAGLDDSVIGKLTTYRYRSAADRDGDCSVCLGEFRDGESVRLLPKCCHAFHQSCIDMWLKSHSSCPLCRAGVVEVIVPVAEETGTAGGAVVLGRGSEGERREEEEEVAIEIGEEGGQGGAETAESSAGRRALISV